MKPIPKIMVVVPWDDEMAGSWIDHTTYWASLRSDARYRVSHYRHPSAECNPEAQAHFASTYTDVVNSTPEARIIVETFSDWILDRFRIEVAEGRLAPEDLLIVWCHGGAVHEIHVDVEGNVVDAPKGYRGWQGIEQMRLLTKGAKNREDAR